MIGSVLTSPKSGGSAPKASTADAVPVSDDTPAAKEMPQKGNNSAASAAKESESPVHSTAAISQSEKLAFEFGRRYKFLNDPDPDIRQGAMKSILKFFHKNTGITARDIQNIARDLAPVPRQVGVVATATTKPSKSRKAHQKPQKKVKMDPRIAALRKEFKGKDMGPSSEYAKRVRALRKEAKIGL